MPPAPPQTVWTPQLILQRLIEILYDALGVDEDEVTLKARFVHELGAESIDFLDMFFRSEKAFSIKIKPGKDFPKTTDTSFNDPMSPDTLTFIAEHMPFASPPENPGETSFADFCTVEFYCKFIAYKLGVTWTNP